MTSITAAPATRPPCTAIKVPVELRDRLKRSAAEHGQTMAELIDTLLRESARYARMESLRQAIAQTPASVMAQYTRERDEWLDAHLD
ncbi:DNA mismatch repair protein MutS [Mobiluncus mulieris]|uniref:DNA mismatch repair protein MutS n=1 Tax=Mobiluncus mulieris TaxID=2052 RepID=A0A7Y0Y4S2_9ACTO|nr:DNA mismatch repair protein MutS [Mobiluncus mulieris]MCU9996618.1 DNA mismatch repair protein MutS [Mobiluncus mulieris]NMW63842.1 DNA mismatch repair protein MutS [Mobiluncus mulieris]NMW65254.1 DNA mismatch repair protein MutS [Mobiluncus mulieris]